ncbi:class Ib ribonucleoside-diphosphate reductase assembly flavoprotein NrdI [Ligilactobacillus sp. LYQ112]|uniref:class Ib ribonucleoside-diphosphate reductase assembly flavoprotein NrdI n=1 Tax=unclassified Ligilactobacillus TaxID=2767920 RepID=UPI0038519FEF
MRMINILFISIEGNTRTFIQKLTDYAEQQHAKDDQAPLINAKEISDVTPFTDETADFFVFVPTYLDGGNGIDNGVKELMTNSLGEYIEYNDNSAHCRGVIGSGNRNFNQQYCLTARRYAEQFNAPFLDDYELRGTTSDVARIYTTLVENN